MIRLKNLIFCLPLLIWQVEAHAALDLVLKQGVSHQLPIAVVPFSGQGTPTSLDNVSSIIQHDLSNSGQFKVMDQSQMTQMPHGADEVSNTYWRGTANMNDVLVGQVKSVGSNQYQVNFSLVDVFKNPGQNAVLMTNSFTVPASELRTLAHHISDLVYQQLTGVRGIFSTRIAYVLIQRNSGQAAQYSLMVADEDGFNPRAMLTSKQPIMSPSWSRDGKEIAYVSFESVVPKIYVQDIVTGSRHVLTSFPGINGAPAWSPDGKKIALVLSKNGSPKIYLMTLDSGQLQQLTQGTAIDTEPSFSPDGQSIIFTSDRGGGPQIYQLSLDSGSIKRLTFQGDYNARASFTPQAEAMVLINRESGSYNIAIQDLKSAIMTILTRSGHSSSPSIAPNGKMVLYESDMGARSTLGMVSTDAKVQLQLPSPEGNVQDPAWSPFL